jgi:hypothetical protein
MTKVVDKFKEYIALHQLEWPDDSFHYIDPDYQNELLGMDPFPESGIPVGDTVAAVLAAAAIINDEQLRTTVLLARLTRPRGVFYWILRFAYESRGYTLREDDSEPVHREST